MKKILWTALALGMAQGAWAADINVEQPWARPTLEGMSMGGAFMLLKNDSAKNDALIGGESPVAAKIEIHTHVREGDVMKMREVPGGIPLPAKQQVALQPGAYHVMLMGLKKPLKVGEQFPLTLKFKHAKPQTVQVKVENMQGAAMDHGTHEMKHHH